MQGPNVNADRDIVLASSMKLQFPMNGALPAISHTRDRLLAKIFRFRQEEKNKAGATDEDFELLYAYGQSIFAATCLIKC